MSEKKVVEALTKHVQELEDVNAKTQSLNERAEKLIKEVDKELESLRKKNEPESK